MTFLHAMTDTDFAWMMGEAGAQSPDLTLPDVPIASAEIITMLRGIAADLAAADDRPVAWLAAEAGAVVAMIGFTRRGADGRYELGYGVAPAHRGRGIMTRALACLLPVLAVQGHDSLTVETSVDNPASQHVLERNGFARSGTREDPEDGALILWAIDLYQKAET